MIAWVSFWTFATFAAIGFLFQLRPIEFGRRCCELAFACVSARLPRQASEEWRVQWTDSVNFFVWEHTRRGLDKKGIGLGLIGEALALAFSGWGQRQHYRRIAGCVTHISWALAASRFIKAVCVSLVLAGALRGVGVSLSILGYGPITLGFLNSLAVPTALGISGSGLWQTFLQLRAGSYDRRLPVATQAKYARGLLLVWTASVSLSLLLLAWGLSGLPWAESLSQVRSILGVGYIGMTFALSIVDEGVSFAWADKRALA